MRSVVTSIPACRALVVVATALWGLAGAAGADEVAASERPTVAAMASELTRRAAEFEDRRDVKCWTSFKQLETFVAGCSLEPETTHVKSAVVINYLDQLWRAAATASKDSAISAATWSKVVAAKIPFKRVGLLSYELKLADRTITLPYQDVENYLGTVEPIRLLQTLAQQVALTDPGRPPIAAAALDDAFHVAALLSSTMLKQANIVASEHRHETIENDDVLTADARFAAAAGFSAYDAKRPARPLPRVADATDDPYTNMLTLIAHKVRSLEVFNTTYSRERLQQDFDADLSRYRAEWAGMPVAAAAADLCERTILVSVAEELYRDCAEDHPEAVVLTGSELSATVQDRYPHIVTFDGYVMMFPEIKEGVNDRVAQEYQSDAYRDGGGHWRTLGVVVRRLLAAEGERPPPVDLYGLEELSEFVSIYAVMVLKMAGIEARAGGRKEVDAAAVKVADAGLRALCGQTPKAGVAIEAPEPAQPNRRAEGPDRVREELADVYIAELFTDVSAAAGIDFRHESSEKVTFYRFSPDSTAANVSHRYSRDNSRFPHLDIGLDGGGVAVDDVDGDGLLDIFLVGGKEDGLYRNLGGLRFTNVTAAAGLAGSEEGRGAYFADYDNDGDPDLFLTRVNSPNRLYRNDGKGAFLDVTTAAGLPLRTNLTSHSAVWCDYDNDGLLDLYVGNYGDWLGGVRVLMGHNSRNGQANLLYRNVDGERFEDVSASTGADDVGWTHAVSHVDANGDGWPDLYLANDFGEDVLLLNVRGKRFVDATPEGIKNKYLHGMSVGLTDFNDDGIEDIYVSNISMFSFVTKFIKPNAQTAVQVSRRHVQNTRMIENNLFLVSSDGVYDDRHHQYVDRSPEGFGWAWDADFGDFDNDGYDDLYIVNGREPGLSYDHERNVLFKQWRGHFYDVSGGSGADFAANSRGTAYADFDADGDLDIIVNNYLDGAVLLRNNLQRRHWLRLRLRGTVSTRDAVGARVEIQAAGRRQARTVRGGSGYLSKDPYAVHFGLDMADRVDRIVVHWPSGVMSEYASLAVDREHELVEPRAPR